MGVYREGFPAASIQLSTTPGNVLYACPAGCVATIEDLSHKNSTSTDRTVTAYIVRSGGSIGVTNLVIDAGAVPKTATAPRGVIEYAMIGKTLNAGDFIQEFASAGSAITPMGTVRVESQ